MSTPAQLCSLRVTQQLPADPSPSQGWVPPNLPPCSCKVQNLLWILAALPCHSCSCFLPHLARQILFLCSHLWLPKKIPSPWKPAPHCCCWPSESIHSFSAPPHLRRKQKMKIWAAYAQPQAVKPSGNTCCAPEFLDWIAGAHLEGDNCQCLDRPQHPRTEPLVSRENPKAERWGLKPPGREAPAAISHPSVAQTLHGQSSQPLSPSQELLWSCRWSRSFLQRPEVTSFCVCHHGNLHFPLWLAQTPSTPFSTVGRLSFFASSGCWRRTSHSLSGPLLSQLLHLGAVLWGQQLNRLLHSTCWKDAWFSPTSSQLEKRKLKAHSDQERLEGAVRACWKLSFPRQSQHHKNPWRAPRRPLTALEAPKRPQRKAQKLFICWLPLPAALTSWIYCWKHPFLFGNRGKSTTLQINNTKAIKWNLLSLQWSRVAKSYPIAGSDTENWHLIRNAANFYIALTWSIFLGAFISLCNQQLLEISV